MSQTKISLNPKHPERVCWGCDKYCSADDLRCGNGTIRTQHPIELFGEDWMEWELRQISPEGPGVAENRNRTEECKAAEIEHLPPGLSPVLKLVIKALAAGMKGPIATGLRSKRS